MTGAFWPGLTLGLLLLAVWLREYGAAAVRAQIAREQAAWEGACPDCGRTPDTCSCVDIAFTPWDEDDEGEL